MSDFPTSGGSGFSTGDSIGSMTVKPSGPPPGEYVARFDGVNSTNDPKWGAGAQFCATVLEGDQAGSESKRTGKPQPTSGNITGRLIVGLRGGKPFQPREEVSFANYVGKRYKILVSQHPQKPDQTRLDSFHRLDDENYGD